MSHLLCPCGLKGSAKGGVKASDRSGKTRALDYEHCCGRYLEGESAPTCEALMRSRYSAFVRNNAPYLLATWHPKTRPKTIEFDPAQRWLGLKIVSTCRGQANDQEGRVSFVARYKIAGRGYRLVETSTFSRYGGKWVYFDAQLDEG